MIFARHRAVATDSFFWMFCNWFFIFAFGNLTARVILKYICISITKKKELQLSDPVYLPGGDMIVPSLSCPILPSLTLWLPQRNDTFEHSDYFFFFGIGQSVESTCPRYWIRLTSVCSSILSSVFEFYFHLRFRVRHYAPKWSWHQLIGASKLTIPDIQFTVSFQALFCAYEGIHWRVLFNIYWSLSTLCPFANVV